MIRFLKVMFGLGGEAVDHRNAVARLNRGSILVDVRELQEFKDGHVEGALHVPLGEIRAQGVRAMDPDSVPAGSEVLLLCQSGMRSRIAMSILSQDRTRRYVNVRGGMVAWANDGLPVTREVKECQ